MVFYVVYFINISISFYILPLLTNPIASPFTTTFSVFLQAIQKVTFAFWFWMTESFYNSLKIQSYLQDFILFFDIFLLS